jgi:hypothetical protein
MNKVFTILAIVFMLYSANAQGIGTDKYAHLGVAYATNTFLYGWMHKRMGMPTMASCIFSAAIVSFAGIVKEGFVDAHPDMDDMIANEVGIGLSVGTILLFNF